MRSGTKTVIDFLVMIATAIVSNTAQYSRALKEFPKVIETQHMRMQGNRDTEYDNAKK